MNNMLLKSFLILFVPFVIIQCQIQAENITLKNEILTIENLSKSKYYYKITPESQINIPNYIKIMSKEKYPNSDNYKYAISYYQQDSTFTNRTQLSKLSNNPILYLNKEQIQKGFYLTIECYINKCNEYSITIYPLEFCEIELGQQYTYYITEENRIMNFVVTGASLINKAILKDSINTINIWARGNKVISSKLEGSNVEKHSNNNAYIVKLEDNGEYKYNLEIQGTVGDLINIGSIYIKGKDHNICQNYDISTEFEKVGFLKKNINEEICYKVSDYKDDIHVISIDNISTEIPIYKYWNQTNKYICVNLPNKTNELFFILQNIYYDDSTNQQYYSIFSGYNYHSSIEKGIMIGYIPMTIEEDFNFLTYQIFVENMYSNVSIVPCDNYPFCVIDQQAISKSIPVRKYEGFYSISLNKTELDIDTSPIAKKKKILLLTCNNDINNPEKCEMFFNIYTDKTHIMPSKIENQYKYIRKGNEDNILIKANNNLFKDKDLLFINIELLSGDISLINNSNVQYYENKKSYLYNLNKEESFSLKIKANKNSIYSIKYYEVSSKYEYINLIPFAGNYLLNIQNVSYLILQKTLKSKDKTMPKFVSFYPGNNNVEISYNTGNDILKSFKPNNNITLFYQDIFTEEQDILHIKTFNLYSQKPNLVYMSTKYIQNENNKDLFDNCIILQENIPRVFLFNSKYNENKYSYLFSSDNNELNITFNLLNEGSYEINLYVKFIESNLKYNINSSRPIKLDNKNWKEKCMNEQQRCELIFDVSSKNLENDSYLEIYINEKKIDNQTDNDDGTNNDGKDNGVKKKDKNKIILIIIIVALCVTLVIGAIFIIIGCRKNNSLQEEVNKISFINDEKE